VGGIIKILG